MSHKGVPTGQIRTAPHGLVTRAQLLAEGLSHSAIRKRLLRGALVEKYPGVFTLGTERLSPEGEWAAALLAVGDGAVLSHLSAATLARAWRYREEAIDVLLGRRHRAVAGLRIHQCRDLDPLDVYVHHGIPVTTVARTLVDLSDVLIAEELVNVIHEAAYRDRFDAEATRRAMARANGRRRLHVLDDALDLYERGSAGTRSRAEVAFIKASDLPRANVNMKVEEIEVDLHWRAARLVVEIDGAGHARAPVRREDALKQRILEAEGWTVLRFPSEEVLRSPERVVGQVRGYLG